MKNQWFKLKEDITLLQIKSQIKKTPLLFQIAQDIN